MRTLAMVVAVVPIAAIASISHADVPPPPRALTVVAQPKPAARVVDGARASFDKCLAKAKLADDVTLSVRIDAKHRAHVDHLPDDAAPLVCVKQAVEALTFPDGIASATLTVLWVDLVFTATTSDDGSSVDDDTLDRLRPLGECVPARSAPVHVDLTIARDGRTWISSANACIARKRIRFDEGDAAKLALDLSWLVVPPE